MSGEKTSFFDRLNEKIASAQAVIDEKNAELDKRKNESRRIPRPSGMMQAHIKELFIGLGRIGKAQLELCGTHFNIARGGVSSEKRQEAIENLRAEGLVVAGYEDAIAVNTDLVAYGLKEFLGEESRMLTAGFMNLGFDQERIIIVPYGKIKLASKLARKLDRQSSKLDQDNFGVAGMNLPDVGLILIEEPRGKNVANKLKIAIYEEWIHAFLSYTSRGKTPFFPGLRDVANTFNKKHNAATDTLEEKLGTYYSDPDEQVTKALVLAAIRNGSNYDPFLSYSTPNNNKLYAQSAGMGQRRIDELGIEAVLSGKHITDHEQDFAVSAQGMGF